MPAKLRWNRVGSFVIFFALIGAVAGIPGGTAFIFRWTHLVVAGLAVGSAAFGLWAGRAISFAVLLPLIFFFFFIAVTPMFIDQLVSEFAANWGETWSSDFLRVFTRSLLGAFVGAGICLTPESLFYNLVHTQTEPEPMASDVADVEFDRHLIYERRIVRITSALGLVSFGCGVLDWFIGNPDGFHGGTKPFLFPLLFGVFGGIFGLAVSCLFAPREYLLSPSGKKWIKLFGVGNVTLARVVCGVLALFFGTPVGLFLLGLILRGITVQGSVYP